MIRILHTADVHIGVENYGKVDSTTGLHSRLLDFSSTLNFCIDTAIDKNVDVFLLAGDAYKTSTPTPTHQKILLQGLLRLQRAGIATVIVVGNHDHPLSFGKVHALDIYSDLPVGGFTVFSKPGCQNIVTKNGVLQIVGIPWPSRQNLLTKDDFRYKDFDKITEHISSSVCSIIKKLALSLDPSIPAILTGHLTVSNGVFSGSEKRAVFGSDPLFSPSDLGIEPFNYVALGHLHRHQSLNLKNQVPIIYSGSLDRIDFGEVNDTKGFVIVDVATVPDGANKFSRLANYEFIKTPVRKMVDINVFLSSQAVDNFSKQVIDEIKKHELTDAIVKVFYHIPTGSADTVDLGLVYKHLSSAWHVAGIIPVFQKATRTGRVSGVCYQQMSTEQILEKYLLYKGLQENELAFYIEKAKEINQLVQNDKQCQQENGDSCGGE